MECFYGEAHETLLLNDEQWALLPQTPQNVSSRTERTADRLRKEAEKNSAQQEVYRVKFGEAQATATGWQSSSNDYLSLGADMLTLNRSLHPLGHQNASASAYYISLCHLHTLERI